MVSRAAWEPLENRVELVLTNVATLTLDAAQTGFATGSIGIQTDGATALTLTALPARARIEAAGATQYADAGGAIILDLPQGATEISVAAP